jgi:uncharacterized membrane protein HdeD (DUF308 family)
MSSQTARSDPGLFSKAAQTEAMNAVLTMNWWAIALRGIAGVLFGAVALFMPGVTMLTLIFVFAIYMIVDGVFDLVAAVRQARQGARWGLLVLEAIVGFLAAAVALFMPGLTVLAFVFLTAAWALVTGVLGLVAAFRLQMNHGRIWLIVGSVASIVLGVLLAMSPRTGALVLTWWIGAYALVFGISMLVLAFRLRGHKGDHPHAAMAASA